MDPSKVYLLKDCTSPIVDDDTLIYKRAADDFLKFLTEQGGHVIESTLPLE